MIKSRFLLRIIIKVKKIANETLEKQKFDLFYNILNSIIILNYF